MNSSERKHSSERQAGPLAFVQNYLRAWLQAWDKFWFTPDHPHTLALIRMGCGAMLAYVHLIWATCASDFMGANAWIHPQAISELHAGNWTWSWLWYVDSPALLVAHEVLAILVSLMMMVGLATRISVPVAWFLTLMVCHRVTLALFGLDQIVVMLAMYLMVSRAGSVWSVDAWLARRQGTSWLLPAPAPATANRLATRLIQLHLCVIYLFGGLSKMRGEMWFDGIALWFAVANYEYQSMDLTWLGHSPMLISFLTGVTIFWETFYIALVWPKLTRPPTLAMAALVHGGIAIGLGMVTFGCIMLLANFAFIEPAWLRALATRGSRSASPRVT